MSPNLAISVARGGDSKRFEGQQRSTSQPEVKSFRHYVFFLRFFLTATRKRRVHFFGGFIAAATITISSLVRVRARDIGLSSVGPLLRWLSINVMVNACIHCDAVIGFLSDLLW